MSRHIKSVDGRHLVSVGDEGFFCDDPASSDWTVNCGEGVDTLAFTRLPAIDVLSYHLYPDGWGKDAAWGESWITRHARQARQLGKPSMLGEFGFRDKTTRNPVYQRWTDAVDSAGGNGWLYWILSGVQDDGTLYPDYDGFTVYCPSPVCTTLTNAGAELSGPQQSRPPVADHDTAVTEFDQPVTLSPAANDIAYRTKVKAATIDLDPAAAGQQRSVAVPAGTFNLANSGTVTFTPASGFVGRAAVNYTIRDLAGRVSNTATITVTVKPDPAAAVVIASWENGVEGWAPGNWQTDPGTLTQTADFHTAGAHGLHVASNGGNWFGVTFPEPLNLSGKASLRYEIRTAAAGTSRAIALQVGSGFVWCQSDFVWVNQDTPLATVEIDLINGMSCEQGLVFAEQSADVRGMFIFFNPGEFDIDNVRAE